MAGPVVDHRVARRVRRPRPGDAVLHLRARQHRRAPARATATCSPRGNAFRAAIATRQLDRRAGHRRSRRAATSRAASGRPSPTPRPAPPACSTRTASQVGAEHQRHRPARPIGGGTTTNNSRRVQLHRRQHLKGKAANFRIYDRALTAAEVAAIALTDANRVASDAAALDLGDLPASPTTSPCPTTGPYGRRSPGPPATRPSSPRPARSPGPPPARPRRVTLTATLHPRRRHPHARTFTSPSCPTTATRPRPTRPPRRSRSCTPTTCAATSRCRPPACTARRSPGRPPTPPIVAPTASCTGPPTAPATRPSR